MEDVVAEELDRIALACLAPLAVVAVVGALSDEVELRSEPDNARVLELTVKLSCELVVEVKGVIEDGQDLGGETGDEGFDALQVFRRGHVEEPEDSVFEVRGV